MKIYAKAIKAILINWIGQEFEWKMFLKAPVASKGNYMQM